MLPKELKKSLQYPQRLVGIVLFIIWWFLTYGAGYIIAYWREGGAQLSPAQLHFVAVSDFFMRHTLMIFAAGVIICLIVLFFGKKKANRP